MTVDISLLLLDFWKIFSPSIFKQFLIFVFHSTDRSESTKINRCESNEVCYKASTILKLIIFFLNLILKVKFLEKLIISLDSDNLQDSQEKKFLRRTPSKNLTIILSWKNWNIEIFFGYFKKMIKNIIKFSRKLN